MERTAKILIVGTCGTAAGTACAAAAELSATVISVADAGAAFSALLDDSFDVAIVDASTGEAAIENLIFALRPGETHVPVMVVKGPEDLLPISCSMDECIWRDADPRWVFERLKYHLATRKKFLALQHQVQVLDEVNRTDATTGLANRRAFDERLRDEFQRAHRYDDALALLLVEIDQFDVFADRFGRVAQDAALRSFGNAISNAVRETDFVARFGADLFAALLPKTHLGGGLTVANRVYQSLQKLHVGSPARISLSTSLGVSAYPSTSITSSSEFFRSAEMALARSKSTGRDRISIYDAAVSAVA